MAGMTCDGHPSRFGRVLVLPNGSPFIVTGYQPSDYQRFMTSRIDSGEASCLEIIDGGGCDYLLTDDFRALGEIEKQIGDAVVLSPIILKVLVMRGTIAKSEALTKLGEIARKRDWLGRPIYRYAMKYFDEGLSDL